MAWYRGNLLYGRGRESTPHSICKSEFTDSEFLLTRKLQCDWQGCTCVVRILGTCRPQDPIHLTAAMWVMAFSSQGFLLRSPTICFAASCVARSQTAAHHTNNAMKHQLIILFPFRYSNDIMYSSDHIRSCGWNMGPGAEPKLKKLRALCFSKLLKLKKIKWL